LLLIPLLESRLTSLLYGANVYSAGMKSELQTVVGVVGNAGCAGARRLTSKAG
jgi:hypothetical protein